MTPSINPFHIFITISTDLTAAASYTLRWLQIPFSNLPFFSDIPSFYVSTQVPKFIFRLEPGKLDQQFEMPEKTSFLAKLDYLIVA